MFIFLPKFSLFLKKKKIGLQNKTNWIGKIKEKPIKNIQYVERHRLH